MNKNKDILNVALKSLISRLEKTEKFVVEQAPDICKQMIYEKKLNLIINIIMEALLFVVLLFVTVYTAIKCHQYSEVSNRYNELSTYCTLFGIASLLSAMGFFCNIRELRNSVEWLVYLKKCPKLFLLREFKTLMKGK